MSNTGSVSASVHGYVNVAEIRSGEENRKKYRVPDVKDARETEKVGGPL